MPPIPSESYQKAESSLQAIRRNLADVRNYQLSRLAEFRGPVDKHQEVVEEMRGDLESAWREIQVCKELGEVQVRSTDRNSILSSCQDLEEEYKSLKEAYRQTALKSRQRIKSQTKIRRHELLLSRARGQEVNDQPVDEGLKAKSTVAVGGEDALQTKTNEVTDALRRTTQVMQAELERSVLSVQMLEESTKTLRTTFNLYETYTTLLQSSTKLVKQLEKADWYDRLIIFLALFFFLLVVGFIVKRRVLDKMARGVGWWVGGSYKLVKLGLGRGAGGSGNGSGSGGGEVKVVGKVLGSTVGAVVVGSSLLARSGQSTVVTTTSGLTPLLPTETISPSSAISSSAPTSLENDIVPPPPVAAASPEPLDDSSSHPIVGQVIELDYSVAPPQPGDGAQKAPAKGGRVEIIPTPENRLRDEL